MENRESFFWSPNVDAFGMEEYFTFQLLVDKADLDIPPQDMYLRNLWVGVKNRGSIYLFARIYISTIEALVEDGLAYRYIFTGDVHRSDYFAKPSESKQTLLLDSLDWINESFVGGPHPIDEKQVNDLFNIAESTVRKTNLRPPSIAPDGFRLEANSRLGMREFIEMIKRRYAVYEIPKNVGDPGGWSNYESFAYGCLMNGGLLTKKTLAREVENLASERRDGNPGPDRQVDVNLVDIHPDEVSVRRIVVPDEQDAMRSTLGALLKTDAAEKMHQEILKDVASYLVDGSMHPQESRSVDLFLKLAGGNLLFEIKSANVVNFRRQVLKGAVQTAEYAYAFEKDGIYITQRCLIVQSINDVKTVEYCKSLCEYMGVKLLLYGSSVAWPDRVPGLRELCKALLLSRQ